MRYSYLKHTTNYYQTNNKENVLLHFQASLLSEPVYKCHSASCYSTYLYLIYIHQTFAGYI